MLQGATGDLPDRSGRLHTLVRAGSQHAFQHTLGRSPHPRAPRSQHPGARGSNHRHPRRGQSQWAGAEPTHRRTPARSAGSGESKGRSKTRACPRWLVTAVRAWGSAKGNRSSVGEDVGGGIMVQMFDGVDNTRREAGGEAGWRGGAPIMAALPLMRGSPGEARLPAHRHSAVPLSTRHGTGTRRRSLCVVVCT